MASAVSMADWPPAYAGAVERGVEFVLVDLAEAEHLAEARSGGCRRECTGGGELGCGFENAADQQREHEIAAAIAVAAEHAVEADPAGGPECRRDMAVRQGADDGEGVAFGGYDGAAPEHAAQPFDVGGEPIGEIAQGPFTNLAAFAIALAKQNGGRRVPVGDRFDIHGGIGAHRLRKYKSQILDYMATF